MRQGFIRQSSKSDNRWAAVSSAVILIVRGNRIRKLQTSKAQLKSYMQGTKSFTSVMAN